MMRASALGAPASRASSSAPTATRPAEERRLVRVDIDRFLSVRERCRSGSADAVTADYATYSVLAWPAPTNGSGVPSCVQLPEHNMPRIASMSHHHRSHGRAVEVSGTGSWMLHGLVSAAAPRTGPELRPPRWACP